MPSNVHHKGHAYSISHAHNICKPASRSSERGSGTTLRFSSYPPSSLLLSFVSLFIFPSSQEDVLRGDNGPHTLLGTGAAAAKKTEMTGAHLMEFSRREGSEISHQLSHFDYECYIGELQGECLREDLTLAWGLP